HAPNANQNKKGKEAVVKPAFSTAPETPVTPPISVINSEPKPTPEKLPRTRIDRSTRFRICMPITAFGDMPKNKIRATVHDTFIQYNSLTTVSFTTRKSSAGSIESVIASFANKDHALLASQLLIPGLVEKEKTFAAFTPAANASTPTDTASSSATTTKACT